MIAPLLGYIEPKAAAGKHSVQRTAAAAVNALAAISGQELRFAADGSPRALVDVAEAYRLMLAR